MRWDVLNFVGVVIDKKLGFRICGVVMCLQVQVYFHKGNMTLCYRTYNIYLAE